MIQSNEHIFVFFAVVIALALLHTVNGQYTPAYLQTNMVENDTNKNTFRVIHEQTAAMAFEWNPMTHENFGYVYLVQEVKYWTDTTAKVGEGNIGLLEAIGKPCEASNYRAEGHSKNFFNSNFQTYHMTYKRVPRIQNVESRWKPNVRPRLMWGKESSACEPTDSVIVFRGYSSEPLQMFIVSSDQVEYNMNDFKATEGMEGVFILFNKHGNHFSLPTMAKAKYKKQVGKVNNERPTIRTKPAVIVTSKNKNSANNMTVSEVPRQATEKIAVDSISEVPRQATEKIAVDSTSNNLFTSLFQYPRSTFILIPMLVVITTVISIALFFLIKKLK